MRILCAVVKGAAKAVPSSAGMQRSLETSPMMASRIAEVVPRRLELVEAAIRARDFESFAAIAMAESDDLQEICRTTTPPIQYATEDSYAMIRLIKAFNAKRGRNVLGYTFDAGANCFMFTLVQDLPEVVAMLMAHFPTDPEKFYFQEEHLISACAQAKVPDGCANLIDYPKKSFEMLLESCVGSGVRQLGDEESLSKP
ncbi:unnamed protein product [Phytomonas sp. EM1]|nr:unnamed protein product [Phytomonas sp. EM1]|eukprot:CCW61289.1 unnamed protein product [Phytomonas sp. isolate EM1]